jgi:hypothetical protein
MGAEPKPKAARKKKRRSAPREGFVDYVVAIERWDWGYSLSLNTERNPGDPYHEFRHLLIAGKLLRPTGLKFDWVEVSLLPTSDMSEEKRKDYGPIALGSLEVHPERIAGSIGIPADVLSPILQMLIAKECKFILITGTKFRYRSARLQGFRLEMRLTEDDLPAASAQRPEAGTESRGRNPSKRCPRRSLADRSKLDGCHQGERLCNVAVNALQLYSHWRFLDDGHSALVLDQAHKGSNFV